MLKTLFDYLIAVIALLLVWPLVLLLALLIKLEDGGNVFYAQVRVGRQGQLFGCYKFRTMWMDADSRLAAILESSPEAAAEWAADHKLKNDPRITRVGKFLRKTSLDELPQLINILMGTMSLVGPRPITSAEVDKYGNDIKFYYNVKPGLTGLWQVSGRNDVSYEKRVELDRWYAENWTLWLDISILAKTIPVLVFRKGSY
ncbi:MAG TPA: exopolysaccharide biosynthesis polyprenyl glycosylphosphotransferase [Fimbriimonas sp.]|nr:exopolysaccharide biosynthesis polyprenyl glycosylphosphotransferase [Fimbriimonas sp.]